MAYEGTMDLGKVRDFLDKKRKSRQAELDRRFEHAWQDFESIVQAIVASYHPRRIYQWGSLLRREQFSEISDIDIAVEGILDPGQFFTLYGEAMGLTSFRLDLVQIEKIHPLHARDIRERGRLAYEQS
jgi:predicted nucleotidyltransferase